MTPATADSEPAESDGSTAEVAEQLDALTALLEAIDWRAVPTVSTYEAAAICARVDEARTAVQEEPADGGSDP